MQQLNIVTTIFRLVLAVVIGGLIGLERGSKYQSAGIRTHSLVCLGSTLIMLTNIYIAVEFQVGDPTRMGAQVISGIGFLGAGTIIVTKENKVKGLTTAAGIWLAAAIGLSIGIGFYEGALVAGILVLIVMTVLQSLKTYIQIRSKIIDVYLIVNSTEAYNRVLIHCAEQKIRITDSQTTFGEVSKEKLRYFDIEDKKIASLLTLHLNENFEKLKILEDISDIPGVIFVQEV